MDSTPKPAAKALPAMTWDELDTLWVALRRMARDTSLSPGERGEAEVLSETVLATRNEVAS